jgi:exopolysaccharide biosynthesis polyprenyl glycosylphosphotransferase
MSENFDLSAAPTPTPVPSRVAGRTEAPTLRVVESIPVPPPGRRRNLVAPVDLVIVADVVGLLVGGAVAGSSIVVHVATVVATLALVGMSRLYRLRLTLSSLDDLPVLFRRVALVMLAVGLLATDDVEPWRLGAGIVVATVLMALGRSLAYSAVRALRRARRHQHPTVVIGSGVIAQRVAVLLDRHPEFGLEAIGFVDDDPLDAEAATGLPVLGEIPALARIVSERRVSDVVIAFSSRAESEVIDVVRTLDRLDCNILVVPRLFELLPASGHNAETLADLPLHRLHRAAHRSSWWPAKRVLDIVGATVGLVLAAPLLAVCALAVRLDGGKGVIFRQERVGLDGRRFQLLKFRSIAPSTSTESAQRWRVAGDAKMSRVGRFLRSTSLDELPQLWNVLRGELSLVGPRPERPYFVTEFEQRFPRYTARHRVPAGLTGWAQIHGLRGADWSIEDRVRFDNFYIENWSLWLDIKIILRTMVAVVTRRGT